LLMPNFTIDWRSALPYLHRRYGRLP
jgi:hypothetical protein